MLLKKLYFLFKYGQDESTCQIGPWRKRNSPNKSKIKKKPSAFPTDWIV